MTHKQMSAKGGRAGKGSPAKAASAKKAALARWAKAPDSERAAGVDLKPCEGDGARSTTVRVSDGANHK
jgi:hypothetical protein